MKQKLIRVLLPLFMLAALIATMGISSAAIVINPEVTYLYPVYNRTDGTAYEQASSGIREWKTGSVKGVGSYKIVTTATTDGVATWGNDGETTWYVVDGTVDFTNGGTQTANIVVKGDVRLILKDGATLTVQGKNLSSDPGIVIGSAGITVSGANNKLTIYAQSTGSKMGTLNATSYFYTIASMFSGAGIGGDSCGNSTVADTMTTKDCSNITINGGNINAKGSTGIGAGNHGNCTDITINGGNVVADGGSGASIGSNGGSSSDSVSYYCKNITINGGNVKAYSTGTSSRQAAAIGSGSCSNAENITINGGTVYANANNGNNKGSGAGIGAGKNNSTTKTSVAKNIYIRGGNITAIGGSDPMSTMASAGAGIGGGAGVSCSNIQITGGTVTAIGGIASNTGFKTTTAGIFNAKAAAIGNGQYVDNNKNLPSTAASNITITTGAVVKTGSSTAAYGTENYTAPEMAVLTTNTGADLASTIKDSNHVTIAPYLTFTSTDDFKVTLTKGSSCNKTYKLEYSTDGSTWYDWDFTGTEKTYTTTSSKVFYFRNKTDSVNSTFSAPNSTSQAKKSSSFSFTPANSENTNLKVAASGNIMTLLNYQDLASATMGDYAFAYLFHNCTALTQAPELPTENLTVGCYLCLFRGCTGLTEAPVLPATVLKDTCYMFMFGGCTSLTQAPKLPATTLTKDCYHSMFQDCTSLTQAPELRATTLAENCYSYMFKNCKHLYITACNENDAIWAIPSSGATTPIKNMDTGTAAGGAYVKIPETSGNTNYYKVVPAYDIIAAETTNGSISFSVSDVAATTAADGATVTVNFTPADNYTLDTIKYNDGTGDVTIKPTAGVYSFTMPAKAVTVKATFKEAPYLTFTSTDDFKVTLKRPSVSNTATFILQYSTDKVTWNDFDFSTTGEVITKTTSAAKTFYFRNKTGSNIHTLTSLAGLEVATYFSFTPADAENADLKVAASGNIMTLLNYEDLASATMGNNAFSYLFYNCTALTQAPELPATTLATSCYSNMFQACTSLTQAPVLPATTLATSCYSGMFKNCTSLTSAPELKINTIVQDSCILMFYGCTHLFVTKVTEATDATWSIPYCGNNSTKLMTTGTAAGSAEIKLPETSGNTNYYKVVPAYDIIAAETTNGSISFSVSDVAATTAADGATVTVTVTPENGYVLGKLYYTDGTYNVRINKTGDNYTFVMPAKAVTVYATFDAEAPAVFTASDYYATLTLNESIDVGLVIEGVGTDFDEDLFAVNVNGSPVDFVYDATANTITCVLKAFAPSEMSTVLSATITYNDATFKTFDYSIREYCETVIGFAKENPDYESAATLCKAVLNYGKYAEDYHNDMSGSPNKVSALNSGYEINFDDVTITAPTASVTTSTLVTTTLSQLVLDSKVNIVFLVKYTGKGFSKDIIKIMNDEAEPLPVDSDNITIFPMFGGSYNYSVTIENIGANKLARSYTVTFDSDETFKLTYGVYNYLKDAQSQTSEEFTDTLKTLCKALYVYGEAAKTYTAGLAN